MGGRIPSGSLYVAYTLPFARAITLDGNLNHDGSATATFDNAVVTGPATRFSIGARWTFHIGDKTATIRLLGRQMGDIFTWIPVNNVVYRYRDARSVNAYLTVEL